MEIIRYSDADFEARVAVFGQRAGFDPGLQQAVTQILARVRRRGDAALVEYARQFDQVELSPATFAVTAGEIEAAARALSPALRKAVRTASRQVRDYAERQRPASWVCVPRRGVQTGERFVPLSRIGAYVPGGTAPLVSTALHTLTLARVAGVREIVMVTPPGRDGVVHPALLYAARVAGATEVYRLGGVYAIGALAFGTQSVRKVEKIVGPGNAYVTEAKRQVHGHVGLDMLAGPSEIMIIADSSADPAFVAADMLSQAEHGSGREQALLATTAFGLIPAVVEELKRQSATLSRSDTVRRVLAKGVFLVHVRSLEQAAELANRYAPEHLEIMTDRPERVARRVTAAGAIFLGPWTPEPVGDFVAGPSHVLPTGGSAHFFSGLTVEQFYRRTSVVRYNRTALLRELPHIEEFARAEGLDAHGRSAALRRRAPKSA
ncbi:MAG: histidinol dehydrogenase [Lentisphaerae bacterium RIFOXYB12_FULL_65_16]|nr:MAG: histidinol dehydrogenase [Lentisphaerae bacterium RIFOXYA12_64_32]OGV85716.1 MAG: histidinol dehydrogenase [Lentisphaerae bacterium RIFOXYB12_FULL_65_16]